MKGEAKGFQILGQEEVRKAQQQAPHELLDSLSDLGNCYIYFHRQCLNTMNLNRSHLSLCLRMVRDTLFSQESSILKVKPLALS